MSSETTTQKSPLKWYEFLIPLIVLLGVLFAGTWFVIIPMMANMQTTGAQETALEVIQPQIDDFVPIINETLSHHPETTSLTIVTDENKIMLKTTSADGSEIVELGEAQEEDFFETTYVFNIHYGFDSDNPTRFLLEGIKNAYRKGNSWGLLYDSLTDKTVNGSLTETQETLNTKLEG